MEYQEILYEIEDRILTITLNRPDKMNAFTVRMFNELMDAFDQADADDSVRAVIVTGAGRAFCAGADLSMGAATWDGDDSTFDFDISKGDTGGRLTRRIFDCTKPVIAAINGSAVGVGLTMTLAMDMRLVSNKAKLGFVFAARGIIPEACSSWFLPRLVGISQALEWVYSARIFNGEEALRAGLVRSVHEPEEVYVEARKLALEIAVNTSAVSVALARQMMWKMLGADHPVEAHKLDTRGIFALGASADAKEGIESFLEKRTPNFTDKVTKNMPDFYPWWKGRDYE
ncbi:Enoyl-CoA hydratase/isomerase [Desulfatibacillum aliphaticivorans]|uniref:Enoyl-CoA hydratase/isomerase n=1 Tax=Desulfatibacillum aliphaticivorans TaxID=218208 RepID=B8FI10_DESAL|nr:crotonase/enoyl-CoA hydratase family protein [Desulfatibacillum aliphaticivorans]ACL02577.1 Enoyl-CoA hydratase/isomerase [Desulfatibacillum aliphaticivorans]